MAIQYVVTHSDKYISTSEIVDNNGDIQRCSATIYVCEFDNNGWQMWNGDIPINEAPLTPTSELTQRLIDIYGVLLAGKTIVIDLEDVNGNIVRLV
jgi:hypothetical protein